jgi:hypothetical protein
MGLKEGFRNKFHAHCLLCLSALQSALWENRSGEDVLDKESKGFRSKAILWSHFYFGGSFSLFLCWNFQISSNQDVNFVKKIYMLLHSEKQFLPFCGRTVNSLLLAGWYIQMHCPLFTRLWHFMQEQSFFDSGLSSFRKAQKRKVHEL